MEKIHPLTGAPVRPLGVSKHGRLIWPVMGGSQPTEPPPAPTPAATPPAPTPAAPGPAPQPNPSYPPNQPPPPMFPPPGAGLNDNGYPDATPVQNMTPEQQTAYWRAYARRNEDRIKAMSDYTALKEKAQAYEKHLAETASEQEKAVTAAEQRGRHAALAEAGAQMVEAYVRAAATGRMSDEQVSTLLQGLDRSRFVNPGSGQVDAQMISGYVAMLAPAPVAAAAPAYAPPLPVPGQPPVPAGAPGWPPPQHHQQQQAAGQVPPQLYPGQQWPVYPPQPAPPAQPDMGDGRQVPRYGQGQFPTPPVSALEAGKAVARARFHKPA